MYEYHLINISAYLLINNPMYDVCLTYRWDKLTETWISDLDLALGAAGPVRALINISADSFQYPSINVWCIERTTKQLNTLTGGRTVRILHVYTLLSGHGAKKKNKLKCIFLKKKIHFAHDKSSQNYLKILPLCTIKLQDLYMRYIVHFFIKISEKGEDR